MKHLSKPSGGIQCGAEGEATNEIKDVTCRTCRSMHNTLTASIRGVYNELGYRILRVSEDSGIVELYTAGNSPHDSKAWVSAELGVGLETMREYCTATAKMIAAEAGLPVSEIVEES